MASGADAVRDGLEKLIAHENPAATGISVDDVRRAGGGNSAENWFFEAHWSEQGTPVRHRLVLRRMPENEIVLTTREDEFFLLKALGDTGLPIPPAWWLDREGRFIERPGMVLGRCAGREDRFVLGERNRAKLAHEQRVALARDFADLLASVHNLDIATLDLPAGMRRGDGNPAAIELAKQERECRAQECQPCLELRLAAWWLRDHLPPPPERRVLLHGDFRPGNILTEEGRVTALLDWELAHVGDPAEDLGWYLAPYYRDQHFIEGHWTPEDFIARYEAVRGMRLDRAALQFWTVFAHYKLCGIASSLIRAFLDGDADRTTDRPHGLIHPLLAMIADNDGVDPR